MTTPNNQAESPAPVATSVSAKELAECIVGLGITHIITVPDTVQKTFLAYMEQQDRVKVLTVCTEDEAMGINAGLHATGHRPMMVIQNNGFYASVNTLKALAFDAQVPTFMFVGPVWQGTSLRTPTTTAGAGCACWSRRWRPGMCPTTGWKARRILA